MDIRATLDELGRLLEKGDLERVLQRCGDLLENPVLPENYRLLLLDQKVKALAGLGRVREAVDDSREVLALMEKLFGPDHMHVADILHNLSMYLGFDSRHEEAIPVSERELAIVRAQAPGTDREADALVSLAEHVYELSRFAEADGLLESALALYEKHAGRRSLGVSTCLNNLGRSAENQGRNEEGVRYLEEAASIRVELLGTHPDSAFTLLNYGTGLAALGQYLKASEVLSHCAAMYQSLGMSDSVYAQAARRNLDLCSQALNPPAPQIGAGVGGCGCH